MLNFFKRYSIFKVNNILQKTDFDCIIPCVARLYDISYEKAQEMLGDIVTNKGTSFLNLKYFFEKNNTKFVFLRNEYLHKKCKKIILFKTEENNNNWGHYVFVDKNNDFYNPKLKRIYNNDYDNYYDIIVSFNFI